MPNSNGGRLSRKRLISLGFSLLLGACISFALIEWANSGPSVIIESVDEVDAVVTPNDNAISFVVKANRTRTCPVQVSRFLWRKVEYKGHEIQDFRSIDNPGLPPNPIPGTDIYMLTLTVPPHLPPGQWYERTVTIEECPMLWHLFGSPPHISADHPITITD